MISLSIHDQPYETYSWPEIARHTFSLAKKINEANLKIDRVVALARGGVSIAQSLADLINVKAISIIQSELYTGIGTKEKAPIITQSLSVNIRDEVVLLIDDLADTGESLLFARQYLYAHGPKEVKTATLASKPWTKLTPDFYELRSEAWIIFPWEMRETITTLSGIWTKKGDSPEQIKENLGKLGYSDLEISSFLT